MLTTEIPQEQNEIMDGFRDYLCEYFDRPGSLSQRQLAKRAGISHVFLNRVVQGHSIPSLPIAEKIVAATGSTLGKVLSKIEKMQLV